MKNKTLFSKFEFYFDLLYLILAFVIASSTLLNAEEKVQYLAGTMGLILVLGDSFHLIPRMLKIVNKNKKDYEKQLGFGKFITSITMTIFYLFLWHIGLIIFEVKGMSFWTWIIYVLSTIRIALCFFPQNKWSFKDQPISWGILRNIPFVLEGAMVIILFFYNRNVVEELQWIWLAIILSYIFYIPVVLFANKKPVIGMLMLPKTCMYIWILWMCSNI